VISLNSTQRLDRDEPAGAAWWRRSQRVADELGGTGSVAGCDERYGASEGSVYGERRRGCRRYLDPRAVGQ
jgi:hypothetical protein